MPKLKLYQVTFQGKDHLVTDYVVARSLNAASITYKILAPAYKKPHRIERMGFSDATIYVEE